MVHQFNIIIFLPLFAGIILFVIPDKLRIIKSLFALIISMIVMWTAIRIYGAQEELKIKLFGEATNYKWLEMNGNSIMTFFMLKAGSLSRLILLFIAVISIIINLYTLYREKNPGFPRHFFSWFLITVSCSNAVVLADNILLLLFFWGILGYTLYKLIKGNDEKSSAAAKKTLIIVGSSDALMIVGIALIWNITGTFTISEMQIATTSGPANMAFILLMIGAFTKAGAFPFHTWIPDYAENAHGISSAFLPASLDKLIGIYFLVLLSTRIFMLNEWLILVLIVIGVLTIIIAVMMALIQHNYKKLLGYHAVSQVGYMVLGIGLGSPLGIAAGLFHMINHAVYKSGLFLTATSVQRKTGTTELDETGGLGKRMPVTFILAIIFALSISGIPPLNGFASKWMIYQGIVDFGNGPGIANKLWILWLALAVFGSALTLASFIKFIGGIFLGDKGSYEKDVQEVSFFQYLPKILLALICIGFGAFATNYIVKFLFMPVSGTFEFTGIWNSSLLFWLVIASVLLGIVIYLLGNVKNFRRVDTYIGGEKADTSKAFPVTSFYNTIREFKIIKPFYRSAEKKYFDLYDLIRNFVLWSNNIFSKMHQGILTTYIIWIFSGLIIILLILIL